MHGTDTKSFIRTEECVYWHSPTVKLEGNKIGISVFHPQQQGFEGDSQTRLSVRVDHLPTFTAFEKGIVGRAMPYLCHSTAVATPFGGVVGIDDIQSYPLVKTTALQYLSEFAKWDSKDLTVEALALLAESPEIFNRYIGIEFNCQIGDVPYDLAQPVLDKTVFTVFEQSKIFGSFAVSFVCKGLEFGTSRHEILSLVPNILSEIGLMQDLPVGRKNRHRKTLAVYINSKNVFARLENNIFFVQISHKMPLRGVTNGCALPTTSKKSLESLIAPVLFERDCKPSLWVKRKLNKVQRFGLEESGVVLSRIEFHGDVGNCLATGWLSGNLTKNIQNDAVLERGVFLAG